MIFRAWNMPGPLGFGTPESMIIPEKGNESKGLLPNVVARHAFEQTGFFGAAQKNIPTSGRVIAPSDAVRHLAYSRAA
jgi:hypothetical protein